MKFSTEAIVAATVALVFVLLSLGAIAREKGEPASSAHNVYVATSNSSLNQITAAAKDVLGFY